jgi:hypothetical protein
MQQSSGAMRRENGIAWLFARALKPMLFDQVRSLFQ